MKETKEITDADSEKERILIRRVKQGYQPAFTELITLYQEKVFRMAFGFFRDSDDAMEIVQETFLRLYRKIDGFDENSETAIFRNWVYRMAYNLCIDYYRKFKKSKVAMKEIYRFTEDSKTVTTRPVDRLDQENFRHHLKKSVMRLSKRQKMVFVLKHYSGFKHHEISSLLNLSVGTVKSLYHRAVCSLKASLVGSGVKE